MHIKSFLLKCLSYYGYTLSRLPVDINNYKTDINDELGDLYSTPIGTYVLPKHIPADEVINAMRRGDIFEEEIISVLSQFIARDTAVIDVGANFGQMSIAFSRLLKDSGQVYSFEANPYIYKFLKRNVLLNKCSNIQVINTAVYHEHGKEVSFPDPDFIRFSSFGSYPINLQPSYGKTIITTTIDSFNITTPISCMKVDVQGCDLHVLRGAVNTINRHKMPIIFEYEEQFKDEFNTSFSDYIRFVDSIDYKFETVVLDRNYLILPR